MIILQLNSEELATIVHNAVVEAIAEVQINTITNSTNEHLTAEQASAFTHIPLATIYAYTSSRKIPHKKVGKRLLFSKQELTEWLVSFKTKANVEIEKEVEDFLDKKRSKYIN